MEVWIGMATVEPHEGNNDLGDSIGAAVNVIHLASNKDCFYHSIKSKLSEYGYNLVELEDIELFDFENPQKYRDNLFEHANQVRQTGDLRWGTFYTFDNDD